MDQFVRLFSVLTQCLFKQGHFSPMPNDYLKNNKGISRFWSGKSDQ